MKSKPLFAPDSQSRSSTIPRAPSARCPGNAHPRVSVSVDKRERVNHFTLRLDFRAWQHTSAVLYTGSAALQFPSSHGVFRGDGTPSMSSQPPVVNVQVGFGFSLLHTTER